MFKGFTKEMQQALTNYNQNSKKGFIFCSCDLNYSSDRQEGEYKYDIVSPELQTQLGKIIAAGGGTLTNPKGINFSDPYEDNELPNNATRLKYNGIKNYDCWIILGKKWLRETQENNQSRVIKLTKDRLHHDIRMVDTSGLLNKLSGDYYSIQEKWMSKEEKSKIESSEKTIREKKHSDILAARQKALQEIIKTAQAKGLSESELESKYANWKTFFANLLSKNAVDDYRKKVEGDIEKLVASKSNSSTDNSQTNTEQTNPNKTENSGTDNSSTEEPKEPNNNSNSDNQTKIQALKEQVISVIENALNSDPKLTNSDLGSEYQTLQNKLNSFLEESKINYWKDKVLAHIQAKRKAKKVSQKVDDDLRKTQDPNATTQDKKEALDELDKNTGDQAYEAKKEQIKEVKKEVARDNPQEYRDKIISNLDKKLTENGLNENDLDNQTQQEIKDLKNGSKLEPDQLVETEIRLTEKIGQAGAKKKVDNLAVEVEKVLENKDKVQVNKLKKQLLEIINSSSVYYSAHKPSAEQLLKQLENISTTNNSNFKPHDNSLPLSVKIGIGFLIFLVVGFFSFLIWKGKRTDGHPWKYRVRRW